MKRFFSLALPLLFSLLLLTQGQTAAQGVRDGLSLCAQSVIPALFPFLTAVGLLLRLGAAAAVQKWFAPLMGPLFHLRGVCVLPLAAGLMGGYPTGAKITADLWRQGLLSRQEAERCLAFVNNCGPAFLLSFAGQTVLGSPAAGVWLYGIHILSALLTGLLLCRRPVPPGEEGISPAAIQCMGFGEALVDAVRGAVTGILQICGFVVLFHGLAALLPFSGPIVGVLEMVSGLSSLSPGAVGFAAAAVMTAWGGLSVHCQTMAVTGGLSLRLYWVGKLLQPLLSLLLALAVLGLGVLPF